MVTHLKMIKMTQVYQDLSWNHPACLSFVHQDLCRKQRSAVASQPQRYSALPQRHALVIPGGRFRETYYWVSRILFGFQITQEICEAWNMHLTSGSTIRTLFHGKSNPKDLQVLPLGDVGFLLFFRVVSGDYGKPCTCILSPPNKTPKFIAKPNLLGTPDHHRVFFFFFESWVGRDVSRMFARLLSTCNVVELVGPSA